MISVDIRRKIITLSSHEQGLATAAYTRSAMAPEFVAAISPRTTETRLSLSISEPTLQRMVVKYSEQLVFQPLEEIRYWFTYSAGAYLEPGYPPLYYSRDRSSRISPNKTAVSAIGEAMAGFVAQRLYQCTKLARPNHDYPDMAELVRSEMRRIAQQPHLARGRDILHLALERVMHHVNESLRAHRLNIDLGGYANTVRDKLRFPAKEMQDLANNLVESRRVHKLGAKDEVAADSGRHFIIHELGLREAIQGLLAEPTEDCHELNIDVLKEQAPWRLEGDWFPYELIADEFVIVIDDDGSVFVSTENLPPELQEKASGLLRRVVDRLYA